jgi:outer membrane lipoprotein-sorting protein
MVERVLELLYTAVDRSRTVDATVHRRASHVRQIELMRARGWYRDPPPIPPEEGTWGTPPDVIESTTRLWAARPYWLRWETTGADGATTSVGVKDRELYWTAFGDGEVHTNAGRDESSTMTTEEELLLDPAPLLGAYRFAVRGEEERLGRAALAVTATRRLAAQLRVLSPLDDELELSVDVERGVLLRIASTVEGAEIWRLELQRVVFDEPVAPELFRPLR